MEHADRMAAVGRLYCRSAALVLVLTALAKLWSATGEARILGLRDPLLPLTNRELLLGAGLVELAVAGYLIWGRSALAKHLWVLWLSGNFVLYRLGLWWVAPGRPCRCLGTLTERLPWPPAVVDGVLKGVIGCLLVGSVWGLTRCWRAGRKHGERLRSGAAAAEAGRNRDQAGTVVPAPGRTE